MLERGVYCPDCGLRFVVSVEYACPYCDEYFRHRVDLREHIEDNHIRKTSPWQR
jgi:uncharacterized C2H2 Zn-finger protein